MLIFKKVDNRIEIVFIESTVGGLKKAEEIFLRGVDWVHKIKEEQLYSIGVNFIDYLSDWERIGIIDKLIPFDDDEEDCVCLVMLNGVKYYINELSEEEYK